MTQGGDPESRRRALGGARALVWLAALGILTVTLFPTHNPATPGPFDCLVCGQRGVADVVLNVLMFVPLGLALAMAAPRHKPVYALIGYGALLSLGVELAQVVIPGRDASPGDLLFNTAGAAAGILLHTRGHYLLRPPRGAAGALSLAMAAAAVVVMWATGRLLQPVVPDSTYYVQWTPRLAHLETYDGRVLSAAVRSTELPPGHLPDREPVVALLSGRDALHVFGIGGTPVPALAPLVSVYDERQREILLLGPDRNDLVFRFRSRASELRLDQPDFRLRNAYSLFVMGEPFAISVRREGSTFCIDIAGDGECVGFTIASGWSLLLYDERFGAVLVRALDYLWLTLLAAPVGFWFRPAVTGVLAVILLVSAAVVIPAPAGLVQTPAVLFVVIGAGLALGLAAAHNMRSAPIQSAFAGSRAVPQGDGR